MLHQLCQPDWLAGLAMAWPVSSGVLSIVICAHPAWLDNLLLLSLPLPRDSAPLNFCHRVHTCTWHDSIAKYTTQLFGRVEAWECPAGTSLYPSNEQKFLVLILPAITAALSALMPSVCPYCPTPIPLPRPFSSSPTVTDLVPWRPGPQQSELAVVLLAAAFGLPQLLGALVVCQVHHFLGLLLILHLKEKQRQQETFWALG